PAHSAEPSEPMRAGERRNLVLRKLLVLWRKRGHRGVLLGILCALAVWGTTQLPLARGLEEWLQDGAFSYRGVRPSRAKVILIGMDDQTLDELKKPFSLTSPEIAEVVAFAKDQGALAIGLDLMIP